VARAGAAPGAEERIALLRLDGDWYGLDAVCLEHLVPLVAGGGVVILDDYYVFDGCHARDARTISHATDVPYPHLPGARWAWARTSPSALRVPAP